MTIKVGIFGSGLVSMHYITGLYRLREGTLKPYGVPFADFKLPYNFTDEEVVTVYDVDEDKVGHELREVIKRNINVDVPIPDSIPQLKIKKGILGGSSAGLDKIFKPIGLDQEIGLEDAIEEITRDLKRSSVDVVLNLISTENVEDVKSVEDLKSRIKEGRLSASQAYAFATYLAAIDSKKPIAFVNFIPSPLANSDVFVELYKEASSVILGDDGATGATPLTADLLEHLKERNRYVRYIVQFNIGGNTDFLALSIPERNLMKEKTKSSIVKDILGYDAPHYIKPTGYIKEIGDRKFVSMDIEWITFNGLIDELIVNMRINDSPALAGLAVDAVRISKALLDKGERGTVYEFNAFFMKNPGPKHMPNISRIRAYYNLLEYLKKREILMN
ncbi:myo-inositol-1-phosphate synthase [Ignicoccus islandicus DSM 13165]|uniref:Myo-inositol-1-phosphate synthase n=1 Tax=Ignicoccus islandicus DSM 13165 TaxID=940295 RepID=A0A0U3E8G5_9CREN|nr:myo-inositol-1-phosphate synthase [Ignicoccus islandicus]ALU11662.1 myo-inositol-1-phosphate synthase [Ignicoccus islandicus DSM 13165]